ncbi:MAG TPA: hypothetical protein DDY21_00095 [Candidatus Moranbacteria bacterium]|nr:hypothetical protein [Candidatus Moranbacteria bacterium]
MKECYGKYNFENDDCQSCTFGGACSKMPNCFKFYDKESEFCKKHCKNSYDCSGIAVEEDPESKLSIMREKGQITEKEYFQIRMSVVKQHASKVKKEDININQFVPVVARTTAKIKFHTNQSKKRDRMYWTQK